MNSREGEGWSVDSALVGNPVPADIGRDESIEPEEMDHNQDDGCGGRPRKGICQGSRTLSVRANGLRDCQKHGNGEEPAAHEVATDRDDEEEVEQDSCANCTGLKVIAAEHEQEDTGHESDDPGGITEHEVDDVAKSLEDTVEKRQTGVELGEGGVGKQNPVVNK